MVPVRPGKAPSSPIGETLSHYHVETRLGSGGAGEVFLARDLQLDRWVALKFLGPQWMDDPASAARLRREARAIARLSHPNIATLYEFVTLEDRSFLVLEYIEGESLDRRLARGRMPLEEILGVGMRVARGLEEAHARGIVHRDVKPANVMLTPRGDVKILDFGLARSPLPRRERGLASSDPTADPTADPTPDATTDATTENLGLDEGIAGTLAYMAPEQLTGADPDPSMDVYALGGLLYEMCSGAPAFRAESNAELISTILRDRPPRPGQNEPDLPRELERLIEDCLEKEPAHRPDSAHVVVEELEAIARRLERRAATERRSLAVLPFVDMSPEGDQDYFCDGITEELILGLSRVKRLAVTSRTSSFRYKKSERDIGHIGRALDVDAVLEGSVRRSGERIRITAQLIDVDSGYHLWSESYDRQMRDVLTVQDEIARNIVRALEITLQPGESMPRVSTRVRDPEAYDYYLRGLQFIHQYDRRGMELALKMFALAIEHDEDFALAYTGIANCWSYLFLYADRRVESLREADVASRRALALDPELAEAHVARGQVLALLERHEEAEQAFERALELNGRLFEAAYLYGRETFAQGDLERTADLFALAETLNPVDYQPSALAGMVFDALGDPAQAAATRRRAVKLIEDHLAHHPGDVRALYMGANCLMALGQRRRSLEWANLAQSIEPDDPMVLYNLACIYSMGGELDTAMDCLVRAVDGGLQQKGWLVHDGDLAPLRERPEYAELLARLDALGPVGEERRSVDEAGAS